MKIRKMITGGVWGGSAAALPPTGDRVTFLDMPEIAMFDVVREHGEFSTTADLEEMRNALLFYFVCRSTACRNVNEVSVPLGRPYWGSQNDMQATLCPHTTSAPTEWTRIMSGSRVVGFVHRERNIYALADLVHDADSGGGLTYCLASLRKIFTALPPRRASGSSPVAGDSIGKMQTTSPCPPVTLGSDPEFELISPRDGSLVMADTIVAEKYGQVGADGAGGPLELRPAPANTPAELVENIRDLLDDVADYGLIVSATGDKIAIGAHIHIGMGRQLRPPTGLVTALDTFLGVPLLSLSGFGRTDYRRLGTWESKPWGFEYRTLPAAAMATPSMATSVLDIAQNVVRAYYSQPELAVTIAEESTIPTWPSYRRLGVAQSSWLALHKAITWRAVPDVLTAWGVVDRPRTAAHGLTILRRGAWHYAMWRETVSRFEAYARSMTVDTIVCVSDRHVSTIVAERKDDRLTLRIPAKMSCADPTMTTMERTPAQIVRAAERGVS